MNDILHTPDHDDQHDLSALFGAPQIRTDDDGRHWDAAGREHVAVEIDGETDFVPAADPVPTFAAVTEALASWSAPAWATRSRIEDGGIEHTRTGLPCAALGDADDAVDVTPALTQTDSVEVDAQGRVRVVREGVPVLTMHGARYTIGQAEAMARALLELVAAARGDR